MRDGNEEHGETHEDDDEVQIVESASIVPDLVAAREVLIDHARKTGDTVTFRRLVKQRAGYEKDEKDRSTAAALTLQKRASELLAANEEHRKKARAERDAARLDEALAQQRKAEANARAEETRLAILRENLQSNREKLLRKRESDVFKARQKWLQTEYPREYITRLARIMRAKSEKDREAFRRMIKNCYANHFFRYTPRIPDFWVVDVNFLIIYGSVKSPNGGQPKNVRCSALMDEYLDEAAPSPFGGVKDPTNALAAIIETIAPGAHEYVFTRRRSWLRFLQQNDYVIEKAIICCIWCLSKWLGGDWFPQGIFEWPPPFPDAAFLVPPSGDDTGDTAAVAVACPAASSADTAAVAVACPTAS